MGLKLRDALCFSDKYVTKDSSLITLDDSDVSKTIRYRVNMRSVPTICLHHVAAFSSHFHRQYQSTSCDDPFGIHERNATSRKRKHRGINTATLLHADQMALKNDEIHIFPGQKLCISCYKHLLKSISDEGPDQVLLNSSSESSLEGLDSGDELFSPFHKTKLEATSQFFEAIDITPLKISEKSSRARKMEYLEKKGRKCAKRIVEVLQSSLVGDVTDTTTASDDEMFTSSDAKLLMNALKIRCEELQLKKRAADILSLLTLAPESWTLKQTATFFSVSEDAVRRSRILKEEKGVLSTPDPKKARKIGDSEKNIIQNFYMDDEYSRVMPGRKDVKSVKKPGEKRVRLQKRLLLMNIDELYAHYKDYAEKTLLMKPCGRTKFFQLRPQHVIEVGSAGTHSVCVCEKHQNVKIMIDCLCKNMPIAHMFMDKLVCDIDNHNCMM